MDQMPKFHIRYHNRTKVLLIYLVCWGVAALAPLAGLWWLYPNKLAGSAPLLSQNLMELMRRLPFDLISGAVPRALDTVLAGAPAQGEALQSYLAARDLIWQTVATVFYAAAWLLTLLIQLIWRADSARPRQTMQMVKSAVKRYRLVLLVLWLLNAAFAVVIYLVGLRAVQGFGLWDVLVFANGYVLNVLAAIFCCRNAAPASISGKQAFFRRW